MSEYQPTKEQIQAYKEMTLAQIEYYKPDVPERLYRNLGEVALLEIEMEEEDE